MYAKQPVTWCQEHSLSFRFIFWKIILIFNKYSTSEMCSCVQEILIRMQIFPASRDHCHTVPATCDVCPFCCFSSIVKKCTWLRQSLLMYAECYPWLELLVWCFIKGSYKNSVDSKKCHGIKTVRSSKSLIWSRNTLPFVELKGSLQCLHKIHFTPS